MGALPKTKPSTRRQGKRRATHKIKLPTLVVCPSCQAEKLPHFACQNCGWYEKEKNTGPKAQ
jgi:large subunit ribosomal protein L32